MRVAKASLRVHGTFGLLPGLPLVEAWIVRADATRRPGRVPAGVRSKEGPEMADPTTTPRPYRQADVLREVPVAPEGLAPVPRDAYSGTIPSSSAGRSIGST